MDIPLSMIQDRNIGQAVSCMALSSKQDLIAFANTKGETFIFNHDWVKIAHHRSPNFLGGDVVTGLVWRPDGRALAIGYSSGKLLIKNMDTHETINEINLDEKIGQIDWSPTFWTRAEMEQIEKKRLFKDITEEFIQHIPIARPGISSNEQSREIEAFASQMRMANQKTLSILSVVTNSKRILLYAFGFFLVAEIALQNGSEVPIKAVHHVVVSRDLGHLSVLLEDENGRQWVAVYDLGVVKEHSEELELLSKHNDLLWTYIRAVEQLINKAQAIKEEGRQEMELKIRALIKEFITEPGMPVERACNMLLVALTEQMLMGIAHPTLQTFFEHSCPSHELLKHETAVENTLKTFRTTYYIPCRKAVESMLACLVTLKRWLANEDRFGPIGAKSTNFEQVLQDVASLGLKLFELLHVVESQSKQASLTLTWLLGQAEIARDEKPATARRLSEVELEEVIFVLQNVLANRTAVLQSADAWELPILDLERYLKDEDLPVSDGSETNDFQPFYDKIAQYWEKEDQSSLRNKSRSLFIHRRNRSFKQEFNAVKVSMNVAFPEITAAISSAIKIRSKLDLTTDANGFIKLFDSLSDTDSLVIAIGRKDTAGEIRLAEYHMPTGCWVKQQRIVLQDPLFSNSLRIPSPSVKSCHLLHGYCLLTVATSNDDSNDVVFAMLPELRDSEIRDVRMNRMIPVCPQPLSGGVVFVSSIRNMFGIVSKEFRLRLFRVNDVAKLEIVDDTDRIAHNLHLEAALPR